MKKKLSKQSTEKKFTEKNSFRKNILQFFYK